ncbi:hypothetical protein V6N11_061610 [Hibiscus sabdariffa]|uniref:Uncharacterized protein n=1 Tax=Hibiscus sabdariffa TaxID=183260 RepID=A0ABR2A3N3_9ROSI
MGSAMNVGGDKFVVMSERTDAAAEKEGVGDGHIVPMDTDKISYTNIIVGSKGLDGDVARVLKFIGRVSCSPFLELTSMEIEEIMNLFNSCWFEMEIFKNRSSRPAYTSSERNPDRQTEENLSKPVFYHSRSMSDQLSLIRTSFIVSSCDSFSPDSVLQSPNLHKTISGKEIAEEDTHESCTNTKITRRKKGKSKSLSDLEFEELKGFMDLGFVFSEEDNKDSRLVEIIPGLQRLRKKEPQEEEEEEEGKESQEADDDDKAAEVARPYLSEAWKDSGRRKADNPLMNWRVPDLGNEIDMKDSLRWWAHTVASTVR